MEVVQSRENEPVDPNGLAREGYLAILASRLEAVLLVQAM